jgi:4-hydroxybutyrate CoA-transferase
VHECVADYTPLFLSEIPRLFREKRMHLDIALVQVSPPDAHGFCSFGVSVDVVKAAVESADFVVAEVNPNMPRTLGDSFVHVSVLDAMVQSDRAILEFPMEAITPEAEKSRSSSSRSCQTARRCKPASATFPAPCSPR